jgi:hypothetical protein
MITEFDLKEAIAECEGIRNPTSTTCVKLAAYYSLLDRMKPKLDSGYSGALPKENIPYSNSYFSQIVERVGIESVFPVIDELMETLYVINRPLYENVISKIE